MELNSPQRIFFMKTEHQSEKAFNQIIDCAIVIIDKIQQLGYV